MSNPRILCVDSNRRTLAFLAGSLRETGYEVISAADGKSALKLAFRSAPDLIVADMLLSDMGGEEICRRLRRAPDSARVPLIIVSDSGGQSEMLRCFEMGADDYVCSPFSVREMTARINALLRRADYRRKNKPRIKAGPITIDSETYEAACNGEMLPLTHKEFELLRALMKNQGTILSRDFLLDRIWGYQFNGQTRTVDVHIRNLRMKLRGNAHIIRTVRGEGYVFRSHVS